MTAWTPVATKLPDDDLTVMIALDDGEVWMGFHDGDVWRDISGITPAAKVTHWMDVPEHPDATQTGEIKK